LFGVNGNIFASIISAGQLTGPSSSTIETSIDEVLRVVTYRFNGLQPTFGRSAKELDFHIETGYSTNVFERDQATLFQIESFISPLALCNLGCTERFFYFAGTQEQGPGTGPKGTFAIDGVDGSFDKRNTYDFGIVYNDAYSFTGNFLLGNVQINSINYALSIPELTLTTVPLPPSIFLFFSGLLVLVISRKQYPLT
jgi:hypothetical protein